MHDNLRAKGRTLKTSGAFSAEQAYKHLAPIYDFWAELTESRAHTRALEWAAPQAGEAILEVAVGTGRLFARILEILGIGNAVGLDLSWAMLRRAQARLRRSGGPAPPLCRGDALRLPFADGTFDLLINCYMLDLMEQAQLPVVLSEFRRVLKPRGRLVISNMAVQAAWLNSIWMWLYRQTPSLVGGCRPVPGLSQLLGEGGWQVEKHELVSQSGFRSEVYLARIGRMAA
jgi:ubiquinone/menaquinone biosynthesis C-methylase UbiE